MINSLRSEIAELAERGEYLQTVWKAALHGACTIDAKATLNELRFINSELERLARARASYGRYSGGM